MCFVAIAYGYGFLMVILVSACSLLGVFFIPFVKKDSKFGRYYKYFYALMIALGASALFCDAVLHLIPEVDCYTQKTYCLFVQLMSLVDTLCTLSMDGTTFYMHLYPGKFM